MIESQCIVYNLQTRITRYLCHCILKLIHKIQHRKVNCTGVRTDILTFNNRLLSKYTNLSTKLTDADCCADDECEADRWTLLLISHVRCWLTNYLFIMLHPAFLNYESTRNTVAKSAILQCHLTSLIYFWHQVTFIRWTYTWSYMETTK